MEEKARAKTKRELGSSSRKQMKQLKKRARKDEIDYLKKNFDPLYVRNLCSNLRVEYQHNENVEFFLKRKDSYLVDDLLEIGYKVKKAEIFEEVKEEEFKLFVKEKNKLQKEEQGLQENNQYWDLDDFAVNNNVGGWEEENTEDLKIRGSDSDSEDSDLSEESEESDLEDYNKKGELQAETAQTASQTAKKKNKADYLKKVNADFKKYQPLIATEIVRETGKALRTSRYCHVCRKDWSKFLCMTCRDSGCENTHFCESCYQRSHSKSLHLSWEWKDGKFQYTTLPTIELVSPSSCCSFEENAVKKACYSRFVWTAQGPIKVELKYIKCSCTGESHAEGPLIQALIRNGIFPTTLQKPRTAFARQVLDNYFALREHPICITDEGYCAFLNKMNVSGSVEMKDLESLLRQCIKHYRFIFHQVENNFFVPTKDLQPIPKTKPAKTLFKENHFDVDETLDKDSVEKLIQDYRTTDCPACSMPGK